MNPLTCPLPCPQCHLHHQQMLGTGQLLVFPGRGCNQKNEGNPCWKLKSAHNSGSPKKVALGLNLGICQREGQGRQGMPQLRCLCGQFLGFTPSISKEKKERKFWAW